MASTALLSNQRTAEVKNSETIGTFDQVIYIYIIFNFQL